MKPWLKVGANMSYVYTNSGYPGDQDTDASSSSGNAFFMAYYMGPVYPMYLRSADGNIIYDKATGNPVYDYGSKDYDAHGLSRNYMSGANPVSSLLYDTEEYLTDFFNGKWYATVTPIEGLNVTGTIGYTTNNERLHYLHTPLYGQSSTYGGQVIQMATNTNALTLQALASYSRTFNNVHNMDLMAGYESLERNVEYVEAAGSNLYDPFIPYVSNTIDDYGAYGMKYATPHAASSSAPSTTTTRSTSSWVRSAATLLRASPRTTAGATSGQSAAHGKSPKKTSPRTGHGSTC